MFDNEFDLLDFTENIMGKTFRELNPDNIEINLKKDKGLLGKIVETGFYGYPNNNDAKADFFEIGIELKVSGFITNKDGSIRAKERMKLSSINYKKIVDETFSFDNLLFKNKKILIIWYEYLYGVPYDDFEIKFFQLYDMENDIQQIEADYNKIVYEIKSGKAHLISEGMTTYLGACTSGNPKSPSYYLKQPYSEIKAKKRAFSIKNSYLSGILRINKSNIKSKKMEFNSVEEFVNSKMNKFIGITQTIILKSIDKKRDYSNSKIPKQISKMISDRILGRDKDLYVNNKLFSQTRTIIKNTPIYDDMLPVERMSFRTLRLDEFDLEWEESEWYSFFTDLKMVVLCYLAKSKNIKNGYRTYNHTSSFFLNDNDLISVKKSYDMVRNAIIKKNISLLPYPKSFKGQIIEVAPKGTKGGNCYNNFFVNTKTKVCFMLDKDFVHKKLITSLD